MPSSPVSESTQQTTEELSDEVLDRTIVDVPRSGFARGERVLRPTQVIVSRQA